MNTHPLEDLHSLFLSSSSQLRDIANEIELLTNLAGHPNLVEMLDVQMRGHDVLIGV